MHVLLFLVAALTQQPVINPPGLVNSASFASPVAPGSLATIFGTNLAATTQTATGIPLLLTLAGTSVTVNNIAAPLLYVSPTQINLQIPTAAKQPVIGITTASGSAVFASANIATAAPGLFSANGSGCGPAAALNVEPTGALSVNSASQSASPGGYIAFYGTGFGTEITPPADGTPASGPISLSTSLSVFVGGVGSFYTYLGAAPGLVRVNQVNVRIPSTIPDACAVPVSVNDAAVLSISVRRGGGQCTDPP